MLQLLIQVPFLHFVDVPVSNNCHIGAFTIMGIEEHDQVLVPKKKIL
jgi:hypothetical protein